MTVRPARTARSERTRVALRRAAMVRFLAQGVDATSAEQIADDAGVSLRTFYRHFSSKHDLLFLDYDAGLEWFRTALANRSADESIVESVHSAMLESSPYDGEAVTDIAALRAEELEPGRIVAHIRQVEASFAEVVEQHMLRDHSPQPGSDDKLRIMVAARCIAAAVFGATEVWMLSPERELPELARLCRAALDSLESGVIPRY